MLIAKPLRCTLALLLGCLMSAGAVLAVAPEVKDEANFLRPETLPKANEILRDIKDRLHKEVIIEIFKEVPEVDQKRVKKMTLAARKGYFHEWAKDRSGLYSADGLYILLCKNPPFCQILVAPELRDHLFTDADVVELMRFLNPEKVSVKLRDRMFVKGVEFIRDRIDEAQITPKAASRDNGLVPILWVLGSIVGLWIFLSMVRAVFAPREPLSPSPHLPGQAVIPTPGFMQRMLGSLFGPTMGSWLYGIFFSWQSRHAAHNEDVTASSTYPPHTDVWDDPSHRTDS